MGAITIRRLDDAVLDRLKEKAKAAGRSMEEEARRQLAEANPEMWTPERAIEELRYLREVVLGGRLFPDSTPDIRRWRENGYRDEDDTTGP